MVVICSSERSLVSSIILNVHAPSEEKSDDSKDSLYKELERVFFLNTVRKLYEEILVQKWGGRILSKRELEMRVYIRIVMIMVLE